MNFLFGHAKAGSAKNQRMHSGKTNGWTPKMMEIPKESPFPGVRKNIRCQKCGFFVFFFLFPVRIFELLHKCRRKIWAWWRNNLVAKDGSCWRRLGSGEKLRGEFSGAPTKSDQTYFIPKNDQNIPVEQLYEKGGNFHLTVVLFRLHNGMIRQKTY